MKKKKKKKSQQVEYVGQNDETKIYFLQPHLKDMHLNELRGEKELRRNRPTRDTVGGRVEECLCGAARNGWEV